MDCQPFLHGAFFQNRRSGPAARPAGGESRDAALGKSTLTARGDACLPARHFAAAARGRVLRAGRPCGPSLHSASSFFRSPIDTSIRSAACSIDIPAERKRLTTRFICSPTSMRCPSGS